jgi:hypothetical protein
MLHTMTHKLLFLAAALSLLLPATAVRAQFELEEPEAGEAGGAAPADAAAPPEDPVALMEFARQDAIVAAVLDLPRDTPARRLSAILSLVDLGRSDVAARLLPQLLAAQLDDAERADLVREVGAARLLKLMAADAPGPDGAPSPLAGAREFAQQALDAASAVERDPARIAALIEQLQSDDEAQRYAARVDLRATSVPGLVAMLHALATTPAAPERTNLMAALADMRPTLDRPLVAMLAEAPGQPRVDAAMLAGHLRIHAALPYLTALAASTSDPAGAAAAQAALAKLGLPTPTPAEAQAYIRREMAELDAAPVLTHDLPDAWWSWDAAANQPKSTELPSRERRVLTRARLARALVEAGGEAPAADRRLALVDALEAAQLLGRELPADTAEAYAAAAPAELSALLATAVEQERFAAAARMAADLGARGELSVLVTADGRPSPLADALTSPVRAVRFAALGAIIQLNPQRSFPGASFVPKTLWSFAAGGGSPAAVVASPAFARATDWAGQLRRLGHEATPAATGRAALVAAFDPATAPRLALILLDADIGQPLVREVVFQLRTASLTAGVPILLTAGPERMPAAQRIAAEDPLVLAELTPRGEAIFDDAVNRALALNPHPLADKATRNVQAAQALDWIAKLLAVGAPYDELRRDGVLVNRTLYVPELAPASIRVLATLGTADSQATLADYASAPNVAIEIRRQAAEALAASFHQFGIQLTREQILRQYDRYNASESADAETQQVLGSVLDAIEKKK